MDPSVRREIHERALTHPPPAVEVGGRDRFLVGFAGSFTGTLVGAAVGVFVPYNELFFFGLGGFLVGVAVATVLSSAPGHRFVIGALLGPFVAVAAGVGLVFAMFATGTWKIGGW